MHQARFRMSQELLRDALHLPESTTVLSIAIDPVSPQTTLLVLVDDIAFPDAPIPHEVDPTLTRQQFGDHEHVLWNWNLNPVSAEPGPR